MSTPNGGWGDGDAHDFNRRFDLGSYFDEKPGPTQLHEAYMHGWLDAVVEFLELGQDPNGLEQISAGIDPPLHLALKELYNNGEVVQTLLRAGADPNLVSSKDGSTALHVICRRPRFAFDMALIFFANCDESTVRVDARDNEGWTPLQLALIAAKDGDLVELLLAKGANPMLADPEGRTSLQFVVRIYIDNKESATIQARSSLEEVARSMLIRGADPTLANDEGETSLHLVAKEEHELSIEFWYCILLKISRDAIIIDPEWIDARDWLGCTPLHRACRLAPMSDHQARVAEWLLRQGADPNSLNGEVSTPLHECCKIKFANSYIMQFLATCRQVGRSLEAAVNTQDKNGDTPLHLALGILSTTDRRVTVRELLRLGADPNLANAEGWTIQHVIGDGRLGEQFVNDFFALCDEHELTVQLDARDNEGNTPLHLALGNYDIEMAEILLRRGAHPTLVNARGETPLHVICRASELYSTISTNLASEFFRVNDELQRHRIPIDARDNRGRTPLQWAVTNLAPNTVDVLLGRGADLSNFVFPTEANFDEHLQFQRYEFYKLSFAISALAMLERLEKGGYELDRSDAVTIMRIIDKLGLFRLTVDPVTSLLKDEQLAEEVKKTMAKDDDSDSTTLYDLIQLPLKEAAKRFTHMDLYELMRKDILWKPDGRPKVTFHAHLYEIMSKRFFLSWALEPFMVLTHCRLPILCGAMIIDNLDHEDLFNICLAAEGKKARDGDQNN